MTPKEVEAYYRTAYNFNIVTGMSDNTLRNWIKCGYVPYKSQIKIQQLTDGELVAVWDPKEPLCGPKSKKD